MKNIASIIIGLFLFLPHLAQAEATKEITRDGAIYTGDPAGSEPIQVCPFNLLDGELDFDDASLINPPEGILSIRTTVSQGGGAWAIFNTNTFGTCNFDINGRNYADYAGGDMRLWVKSTSVVKIEVEYDDNDPKKKFFDIPSTGGIWQKKVIPLGVGGFGLTVGDLADVRASFIASVGLNTEFFIDHVRWTKPLTGFNVFPTSHQVNEGKNRQITAEGINAVGEEVIVYPDYSAPSFVGTLSPLLSSRHSILTAGSTDGNVTVSLEGKTKQVPIDITGDDLNAEFGLLSETISGLELDTDSKLLVVDGGGAPVPGLVDDFNDFVEGSQSLKTVLSHTSDNHFSGWFIQFGLTDSSTVTRNMSNYYDGSLRFWLKAPAVLSGKLEVGIRSANVEPGTELSKVVLNNANAQFNNTWTPVTIPLSDFAKSPPWADLFRVKVMASFIVAGNTNGLTQFWVDNLRWDTRIPGPLDSIDVVPSPVSIPVGTNKVFMAQGFDANGVPVDIYPTWDMPGSSLGVLSNTQGPTTVLTASDNPVAENPLRAQAGGIEDSSLVTVTDVNFDVNFNVYSDAGSGGHVGLDFDGGPLAGIGLEEVTGSPPEGTKFFRSTYTLDTAGSFAVLFIEPQTGTRFMPCFENGWLQFWVRTPHDLEISIRSDNIDPDTNQSKFRLSELNVPLNNTWAKVILPLKDLSDKETEFDYSKIKTFFAIAAVESQIGRKFDEQFEVDDIRWLARADDCTPPDPDRIYQGFIERFAFGTGPSFIYSFDFQPQAVTYDQALVAMNFTYRNDLTNAERVFDVLKSIFDGGTTGFHDEYQATSPTTILDDDRLVGPNAWVLLALVHYASVSGSTRYDAMMDELADWIKGYQDPVDGAVKFGAPGNSGVDPDTKSTEFNFDAFAAFNAYANLRGDDSFKTAADDIYDWLVNEAYVPAESRFVTGILNGAPNNDKAVDVYSWAPLATSSFSAVLASAEDDFLNTQVADLTGFEVQGFDFAGPPGQPVDKDAVWVEGTGQMAAAYRFVGDTANSDFYIQEVEKTIVNTSETGQGMPYATNAGTGFGGFIMDSLHPALSAGAWYLFAKEAFNPFKPHAEFEMEVRNFSDNAKVDEVDWNVTVPDDRYVMANQYVEFRVLANTQQDFGLQIYTDNTNASQTPRFVDGTPDVTFNLDSDPAGLLLHIPAESTTSATIPIHWSVKDKLNESPAPADPITNTEWHFFWDRQTPGIDFTGNGQAGDAGDKPPFVDGMTEVVVMNQSGIHAAQGDANFVGTGGKDVLFLMGDFTGAEAQKDYQTLFTLEFYLE